MRHGAPVVIYHRTPPANHALQQRGRRVSPHERFGYVVQYDLLETREGRARENVELRNTNVLVRKPLLWINPESDPLKRRVLERGKR